MVFDDVSAYWLEPDYILTEIVATLVNVMGMPVGVTLFTNGMVMSGILVSEREYLQALTGTFQEIVRSSLDQVDDPEAIDDLMELLDFTSIGETIPPEELIAMSDDDLPDKPEVVRHLHLRDVVVVAPQPAVVFTSGPMPISRLRLTAIDGWMLGQTLEPEDGEPLPSDEILH